MWPWLVCTCALGSHGGRRGTPDQLVPDLLSPREQVGPADPIPRPNVMEGMPDEHGYAFRTPAEEAGEEGGKEGAENRTLRAGGQLASPERLESARSRLQHSAEDLALYHGKWQDFEPPASNESVLLDVQAMEDELHGDSRRVRSTEADLDTLLATLKMTRRETGTLREQESGQRGLYNSGAQAMNSLVAGADRVAFALKDAQSTEQALERGETPLAEWVETGQEAVRLAEMEHDSLEDGTLRKFYAMRDRQEALMQWSSASTEAANDNTRRLVDMIDRLGHLEKQLEEGDAEVRRLKMAVRERKIGSPATAPSSSLLERGRERFVGLWGRSAAAAAVLALVP